MGVANMIQQVGAAEADRLYIGPGSAHARRVARENATKPGYLDQQREATERPATAETSGQPGYSTAEPAYK
ncbi:hypothetical protein ACFL0V_00975 [Nanoarchaeota archaeon]